MNDPSSPIHIRWLVSLRWAAIAAQIASIAGVKFLLRAPFPLAPLVMVVGGLVVANLALTLVLRRGKGLSEPAVAMNLLLDSAGLTALLVWTGGAMNPFTTLYLLQVALAAILVSRRWSLAVTVGAVVSFGALLLARPEAVHVWHSAGMFLLHVRGMWLAFALTAGCLWFFVDRVSASLRARQAELAQARLDAERAERLGALGTLAAGTAHELNTPLGTVAILAAELSEMLSGDADTRAYADRIRAEIKRCTGILARMRSHELSGPEPERVSVGAWVRAVLTEWEAANPSAAVSVVDRHASSEAWVLLRRNTMDAALHNLLDNARLAARDAGGPEALTVELADTPDGGLTVTVIDRGRGLAPEVLARVGEPFFTTRPPGEGMGLGLFLVQNAVRQQGGGFSLRCDPDGTRAEMTLRRAPPEAVS